jgi:hypothetical protein
MPPGGEAGRHHHLEADPVGFALHVAREVELALDVRRLGAGDDGVDRVRAVAARGREQADDQRRQADQRAPRVPRDAARDVPLRHVRHLVPEHRGQLVAADGDGDQPEVHADEAAGQGKGVDARVAHQERLPGEALVDVGRDVAEPPPGGHQRLPHRLQVLLQQGVVDVVRVGPDLAHDLVADLAFGADAEIGVVGIAEGRQVVLRRGRLQHRAQRERQGTGTGDPATQQVARGTARWAGRRHGWARSGRSALGERASL